MYGLFVDFRIQRAIRRLTASVPRAAYTFAVWLVLFTVILFALDDAGLTPKGVSELMDFLTFRRAAPDQRLAPMGDSQPREPDISADGVATRILIPDLGIDAPIISPESSEFNVLNSALAHGAVHYPGSARPGEYGNMFLFGHSTALAVVHNPAYRTFNRLQELKVGDIVRVQSADREYQYRVTSVVIRKADDANIALRSDKRLLTLSTCKVIGAKEDRYIVEAEFAESRSL